MIFIIFYGEKMTNNLRVILINEKIQKVYSLQGMKELEHNSVFLHSLFKRPNGRYCSI